MAKMGRPKTEIHKEKSLTMRMLPEQRERLEFYAKKYGLTKTQVVLKALEKLYEEEETKQPFSYFLCEVIIMEKTRKDSRGYALHTGETQRKDGRYVYTYTKQNCFAQILIRYEEVQ